MSCLLEHLFFALGTLSLFPGHSSTGILWCPQPRFVCGGLAGYEGQTPESASKLLPLVFTCLWLEHWRSETSWYRPEVLRRISHCGLRVGLEILLLSSCFENISLGWKSGNHSLSFAPVHEQVWPQRDALSIWLLLLKSPAQKERC